MVHQWNFIVVSILLFNLVWRHLIFFFQSHICLLKFWKSNLLPTPVIKDWKKDLSGKYCTRSEVGQCAEDVLQEGLAVTWVYIQFHLSCCIVHNNHQLSPLSILGFLLFVSNIIICNFFSVSLLACLKQLDFSSLSYFSVGSWGGDAITPWSSDQLPCHQTQYCFLIFNNTKGAAPFAGLLQLSALKSFTKWDVTSTVPPFLGERPSCSAIADADVICLLEWDFVAASSSHFCAFPPTFYRGIGIQGLWTHYFLETDFVPLSERGWITVIPARVHSWSCVLV